MRHRPGPPRRVCRCRRSGRKPRRSAGCHPPDCSTPRRRRGNRLPRWPAARPCPCRRRPPARPRPASRRTHLMPWMSRARSGA
ncbi:hypothetical protein CRH09_39955 (plasmid) [Nocardia terpenica]|uniref:Uncharacterized protein n=1 Tax=Nocardia terpenica TaxID=455432 RepID=A0A291RYZ5_9NOCA|nr:hypothetical protein CRH09_39955 [Nocardia terpenica]